VAAAAAEAAARAVDQAIERTKAQAIERTNASHPARTRACARFASHASAAQTLDICARHALDAIWVTIVSQFLSGPHTVDGQRGLVAAMIILFALVDDLER